eukprot:6094447-Amphidinium_carterae.1
MASACPGHSVVQWRDLQLQGFLLFITCLRDVLSFFPVPGTHVLQPWIYETIPCPSFTSHMGMGQCSVTW